MGPHRGSTIYIPIIIPENWQVAASVACAAVAVVLLSMSLAGVGGGFEEWRLTVPASSDNSPYSYPYELQVSLQWGLRYLHVSYCRTHSGTQSVSSSNTFCGSDDVNYNDCSVGNTWCKSSPDPWLTYVLMLGSIIGLVLSTVVSLSRRVYQPAGYSVCTIACSFAVVIWRMALGGFEASDMLVVWLQKSTEQPGGKAVRDTGASYYILTAALAVLFVGLMLSSWGAVRARRADAEREVDNVADQEDVHNAPAPAAVASASSPHVPPASRPPAVRESMHAPSSRILSPPRKQQLSLEDGGDDDLRPMRNGGGAGNPNRQRPTTQTTRSEPLKVDFAEGTR